MVAAVAIAIAAPYLAPLALGALGITATATAIAVATAVIGIGLSVAVAVGMRALGVGAISAPKTPIGPPSVFRQSITDSFIVYGKRRVGGLLVFFHAKQVGNDHFRYFVIACAGHRCQGVVSWMLNDEIVTLDGSSMVTSGPYANAAWLYFQRGLASETANPVFTSECGGNWTSDHKGNGTAAMYARFRLDDAVIEAGMPNITAIIEGRDEILDPRTSGHGYTRNAALIFYDWMKLPREEGGFGAYADEIPDDTFISAQANVCDEVVESQPRYAFDAFITTGATPSEVRDVMVVNCGGSYTYSGGKHLMRPGYWVPVSQTLSEDDLAGPIQVSPFMASDSAANEVSGTYVNVDDGYQGAPFASQLLALPPDDIRQLDLDLAFVTNKNQAERVASIMLQRAQHEKTVMWPSNIVGLNAKALDTIQLDSARYGLSNYAWQVAGWSLSSDYNVILSLREESEDIYTEPTPVSPSTPATIVQSAPVMTSAEIQNTLRQTYPKGLVLTGADNGASAKVTLSAFTFDYPGTIGDVVISGTHAITGLAFSGLFYVFADVDDVGDAAPTYGVTTSYADALNSSTHPKRIFLGTATTPADGSGVDTSYGGGGGGYGGVITNPDGSFGYA